MQKDVTYDTGKAICRYLIDETGWHPVFWIKRYPTQVIP